MKAVHISDTHGRLPPLPDEAEVVFHTGDFFPDGPSLFVEYMPADPKNRHYQCNWIYKKRSDILRWLGGRTLIATPGNHDFASLSFLHHDRVYPLVNEGVMLDGRRIFGMPHVPRCLNWNYGTTPEQLQEATRNIPEGIDVLLCHAPPAYGGLDVFPNGKPGNEYLIPHMSKFEKLPRYVLCGHIHEQGGKRAHFYDTEIINSATTMTLIDL